MKTKQLCDACTEEECCDACTEYLKGNCTCEPEEHNFASDVRSSVRFAVSESDYEVLKLKGMI